MRRVIGEAAVIRSDGAERDHKWVEKAREGIASLHRKRRAKAGAFAYHGGQRLEPSLTFKIAAKRFLNTDLR